MIKKLRKKVKRHLPVVPGILHARVQSVHGPKLPPGFCLGSVAHFMLGHPSGQETAILGWVHSQKKHSFADSGKTLDEFLKGVPRGFPLWFDGGSPTAAHPEGDGHVVISGTRFFCWSEDRKRTGFYDRVTVKSILTWNPTHPHRLLGWTEDVAGFPVGYAPHSKDRKRYGARK